MLYRGVVNILIAKGVSSGQYVENFVEQMSSDLDIQKRERQKRD